MHRALLLCLTLFSLPALAFELQPFTASYTADWKQVPISGTVAISPDCFMPTTPFGSG